MRELFATRQFEKDLRKIPIEIKNRADLLVQELLKKPEELSNVKKLKSFVDPELWRVRIGSYRLLYSFDNESVILHRFAHRKNIYRKLK